MFNRISFSIVNFIIFFFLSVINLIGCSSTVSDFQYSEERAYPTIKETLLVKAAWDCNKEAIIELLSDNSVNVDAKNEFGTTALMAVSERGCVDLVELLIKEYRANVNIRNFYGRTALMLADYSSLDTMKLLVNNGADVNVQNVNGSTTLMLVAGTYENYVDVLSLLLDNGADVTIKDNNGKTAIDYAKDAGTAIIGTPPDKSEIMRLLQQQ